MRTTVLIEAQPEAVWAALTDFAHYPRWSRFIEQIDGVAEVGAPLRVVLHSPGSRPVTVRPTVTAAEPCRRFAWTGSLVHPRLFSGIHSFELEPRPGGRTEVRQSEHFEGLVPTLLPFSPRGAGQAFAAFDASLKTHVEHTG